MIKITLKYGENEKKMLVPEQKKVIEFLKEAEIKFSAEDGVFINEELLSGEDINKNLLELGYGDSSEPTIKIEYDLPWETGYSQEEPHGSVVYPPKVRVIGCACIIFSAFTPDELRDLQRYIPDAMTMRSESGEPVFAISLDEASPGSLNKYGAVFSKRTTSSGNATITILIDPECDDPEEAVRESLGSAILNLVDMEEKLMKRMNELEQKKNLLNEHIAVN